MDNSYGSGIEEPVAISNAIVFQAASVNIVLHPAVQGKITLEVHGVSWDVLLDVVLKNYGLSRET
jgi:hypothetical protein